MSRPRFHVLDIVEIGTDPTLAEQGLAGRTGVITEVRRYKDGRCRYGVGSLDTDLDVSGLYDEDHLLGTGRAAEPELFRTPGPFRVRDVVRVSMACDQSDIAGRTGVVEGGSFDVEGPEDLTLAIWVEDLGEFFVVERAALTTTGVRLPPPPRGRTATSTRVSVAGEILGQVEYVIVDDIGEYL